MNDSLLNISEIKIKYNPKIPALLRPKITHSRQAYDQVMPFFNLDLINIKEEAVVLFLNRGNRVIGAYKISSGGMTGTMVDIRLILAIALKGLAIGVILAHSHPSGELKPSKADEELTQKFKEAASFMDIKLLDHLIVSADWYYSFEDEGLL